LSEAVKEWLGIGTATGLLENPPLNLISSFAPSDKTTLRRPSLSIISKPIRRILGLASSKKPPFEPLPKAQR
jgi:hypothetical protein